MGVSMMTSRHCRRCDGAFEARQKSSAQFCSDTCRDGHKRDEQARFRRLRGERPLSRISCSECGSEFQQRSHSASLCSDDCRKRNLARKTYSNGIDWLFDKQKERKCDLCGCSYHPIKPNQRFCNTGCDQATGERRRRIQKYECQNCGDEFHPKDNRYSKFCGRECAYEKQKSDAAERAPELEATKAAKLAAERERKRAERQWRKDNPVYELRCEDCGESFRWHRADKKFCSTSCQARNHNRKLKRAEPRPCKECGGTFTPEYGNKRRDFCSKECSRRHGVRIGRANRRAREKEQFVESVDPFVVFDRDKWQCHLCGVKTPKKLRGTLDDRAPELDHIVPLAAGGSHSYANTACACRSCNIEKGAQPLGQPSFDFAA